MSKPTFFNERDWVVNRTISIKPIYFLTKLHRNAPVNKGVVSLLQIIYFLNNFLSCNWPVIWILGYPLKCFVWYWFMLLGYQGGIKPDADRKRHSTATANNNHFNARRPASHSHSGREQCTLGEHRSGTSAIFGHTNIPEAHILCPCVVLFMSVASRVRIGYIIRLRSSYFVYHNGLL